MKADKGAAASGPAPHPPGDFQAKACNLLRQKERKKERKRGKKHLWSYRQLQKKREGGENTHTHTHKKKKNPQTHTNSKPFPTPPTSPNTSLFPSFFLSSLSLRQPPLHLGGQKQDCLLVGRHSYSAGRAAFGQSETGEPPCQLSTYRHQLPLAPTRGGRASRVSASFSKERTVCPPTRNH